MAVKYNEAEIKQITNNMPDTIYPRKIEDWYARQIIRTVTNLQRQAIIFLRLHLADYLKSSDLKLDAMDDQPTDPDKYERLARDLDLLAFTLQQQSNNPQVRSIATKFVKSIDAISYKNVKMQAGIVGIDPIRDDFALKNYIKGKIEENTLLIKSMQANYATALQKDIYRSITSGSGVTQVTKAITDRTHMAVNHAKLIANDQTGSVISQLDAYRAKRAGARKYIWRSMEDNRVRPRHRELDGTEQIYDDPDGGDGGQMPGEPIRCRCVALPVFDESTYIDDIERGKNKSRFQMKEPHVSVGTNKVDLNFINSDNYKKAFEKLSENSNVNKAIYKVAKAVLVHRSNTDFENSYIINDDGKVIVTTLGKAPLEVGISKKDRGKIKDYSPNTLIGMHNHPTNIPPDGSDFNVAAIRKYKFGIIVTHDGHIYKYSIDKEYFPSFLLDSKIEKYRKMYHNMNEEEIFFKAFDELKGVGLKCQKIL